ncbi:MAG: hypothetical protein M3014_12250, partial [Chloroflexota bacterium]|nr:hypothetical protein [Chloroflexota bacterium]
MGCDTNSLNIKNSSPKAAGVYVTIPEAAGKSLYNIAPGDSLATDLGDSGTFTIYVVADTSVSEILAKTRQSIEEQLAATDTRQTVDSLRAQLSALNK